MADRISSSPDSLLCYILSFLPTKQVVATSVLSKRWNLLWRSVPSLDFDHHDAEARSHFIQSVLSFLWNPLLDFNSEKDKEAYYHFLHSVNSFLLSRDLDQPLHRFYISCGSFYCDPISIQTWVKAATSGSSRLQHLHFNLDSRYVMPSEVFSCKTLVVLKLACLTVEDISFVDLPLLKISHLNSVRSSDGLDLSQLFSGSPNLEDLEVKDSSVKEGKFNRLPKLVRANIHGELVPLEIVKNAEVLFIDWIYQQDLAFDFQNLVQLELNTLPYKELAKFLKVLNHCPKLQTLVIGIYKTIFDDLLASVHEEAVSPYPQSVPACISLHLKTCRLKNYSGSIDEFLFASYIMQNTKYLRTMKICTASDADNTRGERLDLISELSSCMKSSDTCTLSFE